jgi:hypothetical protein
MSEPLATYREVRSDGRRRFELYADRIVVKGSGARTKFEATVLFANLRPEPDKLWIRHKSFLLGVFMLLLSIAPFAVLARSFADGTHADRLGPCLGIGVGLSFVGFVICLKTFRKVEFARFQSHAGIVVLDVAYAGPDRGRFREFVDLLTKQIRMVQNKESRS